MQNDVCISGGGPAGLAAALAFRRRGFAVTVVDCAVPPIDKACGEGLMPDSLEALRRLGVELPAAIGYPFKGIRFSDGASTVSGDFPGAPGLGVRRFLLHGALVKRAEACGVRLLWGAKHVKLCADGLSVQGERLPARLVVGADGQKSAIRKAAGLDAVEREKRRFAYRTHYRMAPWSDYVELHWNSSGQVYITPVAENEICVVFISRRPHLRVEEALAGFPVLRERLAGVERGSHEAGSLSISRRLKRVQNGKVALVGDASGSVDAVTGEGMCLAFKQAYALAEAWRAGDLLQYARYHREICAKPRLIGSLMLAMELHGELQRRSLAGLAKHPRIFENLLRFHLGQISLAGVLSPQLFGFGMDFLTA